MEIYFARFWRLEVRDWGASVVGFSSRTLFQVQTEGKGALWGHFRKGADPLIHSMTCPPP